MSSVIRDLREITAALASVRAERGSLIDEMNAIDKNNPGELPPGAADRWNRTCARATELSADIGRLEGERDEILAERADQLKNIRTTAIGVTGDGARAYGDHFNVNRGTDIDATLSRAASLGGADTPEGTRVLVDACRSAIDMWPQIRSGVEAEHQESALSVVTGTEPRYRGAVAQHVAALSSPDYNSAFVEYMTSGPQFMSSDARRTLLAAEMAANRERAMNEGSVSAGQAMVPPFLDPTIILTNTGTLNPLRQISDVRMINTQVWHGVTTAGVTAEWTAEAAEATDASPTDWASPAITPVRADAYVQVSYELAMDTSIVTDIAVLFADAKDRLESTAFVTGTGSTQPFGIVTELNLTTASRVNSQTNGSYGAVDVFALDSALPARYRPNASWIGSPFAWNATRQFATGPSPQNAAFWVDFAGDLPSKLLGHQVYESSAMIGALSTATASNDDLIVLGDFRAGFKIIDRVGMSIGQIDVIGANRRPIGSRGFFAFWRVGSATVNPDAFRMLVV